MAGHHSLSCGNLYFFGKAFFSKERFVYNLNIQFFAGFPDNFLAASATSPSTTFMFWEKLCDRSAKTPYAGHDENHALLPFPSSLRFHFAHFY